MTPDAGAARDESAAVPAWRRKVAGAVVWGVLALGALGGLLGRRR